MAHFAEGDVVDWPSVCIEPYLIFVIEGAYLVDMAISTGGLVYWSRKNQTDLLGSCNYIDTNYLLNECSIITQECNIWRLHYEDKWEDFKVDKNRLLVPSRYPFELINHLSMTRG